MAFNPRPWDRKDKQILSGLAKIEEDVKNELGDFKLKPIPQTMVALGEKIEYYIQLISNNSTEKGQIISGTCNTAHIKNLLSKLIEYGYTVQYLKRTFDQKVIWDKR